MKRVIISSVFLVWMATGFSNTNGTDHDPKQNDKNFKRKTNRASPSADPCLGGRGLAAFANGDEYDMGGMVNFLSDESCQDRQSKIVREALSYRISFNEEPFRLKQLSTNYNPSSLQSVEHVNQTLLRTVPIVLKDHPLTNESMLPVLGQVAVLSQPAARKILGEMIRNELISSDGLMKASNRSKEGLANDLAQTLMAYGAKNPQIAMELAEATEELALSAQVDSLGKMLSSLAEAARAESELIPTLEMTVTGTRKGVEKGDGFFSRADRQALLKVIFDNIQKPFLGETEFDGVSQDYNKVFSVILKTESLMKTNLRDLWRESLKVLGSNRHQDALAGAVALSLTGDVVYLGEKDRELLLLASANYGVISIAYQRSYLAAWQEAWEGLQERLIPSELFNRRKDRYFIPAVEGILELEPAAIETAWLRFVWEKGFVKDEQIETRFPKLFLSQIKRRERALKSLEKNTGFEMAVTSLLESLAVSRSISSVQLPALNIWIKKNELSPSGSNSNSNEGASPVDR